MHRGMIAPALPVECLQFVQAPMVVISDLPFRLLTARWGATLTYTQMYHTSSLPDDPSFLEETMRDLKLGKKLRDAAGGPLVCAQLAGNDPQAMGRAGKLLVGLVDALEINLGCPQRRAKEGHFGGYLLNVPDLELMTALANSLAPLPLPLHLKIRFPHDPLTLERLVSHLVTTTHVSVITLHCRPVGTPKRRRDVKGLRVEGAAECRSYVDAALAKAGRDPGEVSVVGNGGVQRWEDVGELTERMGVEGWMVGEELAGNPRFFTRPSGPRPSALTLAIEYLDLVDVCAEAAVPLVAVKRHLRDFVEADLVCSRSRLYNPFVRDLDAATTLVDVRRICEATELVELWVNGRT